VSATPTPEGLLEFVRTQRWFGAKGREIVDCEILDRAVLEAGADPLTVLLFEVRYGGGSHDIYQVLVRGGAGFGVLDQPDTVARLLELAGTSASVPAGSGTLEFATLAPPAGSGKPSVRPIGVEQSNSSVVVDEELIVKLYRRLEPGVNPELELLRFFAEHDFPNVPRLESWWGYAGSVTNTTLGIAQQYLSDATDGWSLALFGLQTDADEFLAPLARLGEVVGTMHSVLASDSSDPAFAPEDASPETLSLLTATMDDEIEEVFVHLPDDPAVAPLAGYGDAVRELLAELATSGVVGKLIRHHGDLHLGQVLRAGDDWHIVDFEGEPARSLPERRTKRSPLRDVAGMLRSFAYAVRVAEHADEATEQRARELFMDGYLPAVEGTGILPPQPQLDRLIGIFELEKAVYELRYELSHRPDWVHIPVAAIGELLERTPA